MAPENKVLGCETRYGPEPECIRTEFGRIALGRQASSRAVVGQRALCIGGWRPAELGGELPAPAFMLAARHSIVALRQRPLLPRHLNLTAEIVE